MLCYRDKTFCASKTHKGCGREITKAEREDAKRTRLPIAWAYFCGEPPKPLKERKVK